ncbi:MAG: AgmX/PglI C-terminal domain-containing protein [Polyangiaceae bacterium]
MSGLRGGLWIPIALCAGAAISVVVWQVTSTDAPDELYAGRTTPPSNELHLTRDTLEVGGNPYARLNPTRNRFDLDVHNGLQASLNELARPAVLTIHLSKDVEIVPFIDLMGSVRALNNGRSKSLDDRVQVRVDVDGDASSGLMVIDAWQRDEPELRFVVTQAGVLVEWSAHRLAPGCGEGGPGVTTIPRPANVQYGTLDLEALARCTASLKEHFDLDGPASVYSVGGTPGVLASEVVAVARALSQPPDEYPHASLDVFTCADHCVSSGRPDDPKAELPWVFPTAIQSSATSAQRSSSTPITQARGTVQARVVGQSLPGAAAVVAGLSAGFRSCYDRGLQDSPEMRGSVRFAIKVGPTGEVLRASASGGSGLSGTVIGCLASRLTRAQFAPPPNGETTLVIPITLAPD